MNHGGIIRAAEQQNLATMLFAQHLNKHREPCRRPTFGRPDRAGTHADNRAAVVNPKILQLLIDGTLDPGIHRQIDTFARILQESSPKARRTDKFLSTS